MEMPTAYIKRLHQFIRQCDRVLYPAVKLAAMTNQAFQLANASASPQMIAAANSGVKNPNWVAVNAQSNMAASNYHLSPNNHLAQEQKNMNKQRKQRGTLVMKSYPNTASSTSPSSKNNEWQQQQAQRLVVQKCRQQQLRAAQQYLAQNAPNQRMAQYQRTNSVPIMRSQQQQQQVQMTGNVYQRE